jgi:mono/diheme cytochrome c family protein
MSRIVLFAAAALVATLNFGPVPAQDMADPSEAYTISRGAQLYDKWWVPVKAPKPETTHPAYPAAGKYKADATWRCKECHGWDYKGADGAYGSGKHFTGIKGINGMAGADPAAIANLLRGDLHGYTPAMLPDAELAEVALFVSKGQVDPAPYMADGKSNGDVAAGKVSYEGLCAGCHGLDGKKVKDADSLGSVSGNTVELMHKVLNGQPGEAMPALRVLDTQLAADIVAYVQTLPE